MKAVLSVFLFLFLTMEGLFATPVEDFLMALRQSRFRDARYYLEAGGSVDTAVYGGEPVLIIMCREQRVRALRWLLEQGANPDTLSSQGQGPLHLAAKTGNREMAQTLLQWKADINLQTLEGKTPLLEAVNGMHYELAFWLESQGGLIKGGPLFSPLLYEIWERRQHCARGLALKEVRWKHFNFLNTVVHRSYGELKTLLEEGANPDAANPENVSALMMSASLGDAYKGELLLSWGANPYARDTLGLTALWYASYFGNTALMERLMNIPFKDTGSFETLSLENSPLFAAWCSRSYGAMAKLIEHGGLETGEGRKGTSLLHYAAFSGDLRTIRMLADAGASLTKKDREGRNAMDYLILGFELSGDEASYMEEARYLKARGIKPRVLQTLGGCPGLSKFIFSPWN